MQYLFNSQKRPSDYSHDFDAHIYFELEKLSEANDFQVAISTYFKKEFEDKALFVGDLIPKAIGPHPKPMFELNFDQNIFSKVVVWLMNNRGNHIVLVHPISGNDYLDHTDKVIWLGNSLKLKLEAF